MVRARQKTVRVFEFESGSDDELVSYIRKNALLLRGYCFAFRMEVGSSVTSLLDELGVVHFVLRGKSSVNGLTRLVESCFAGGREYENRAIEAEARIVEQKLPLVVLDKPVRSGEELVFDSHVVLTCNVHSGASITCTGSLSIYGSCRGNIECTGNYLMLKSMLAGRVVFKGDVLQKELIDKINAESGLKLLRKEGEAIQIRNLG